MTDGPGMALAHGGDAAGQLPAIPSCEAQAASVVLAGVVKALNGGADERVMHGRPRQCARAERAARADAQAAVRPTDIAAAQVEP